MCCRLPHMPRPKLCFHIPVMWHCGLVEDHVPDCHTPLQIKWKVGFSTLSRLLLPFLTTAVIIIASIFSLCMVQFDLLSCPPGRDCGDHFKVVGVRNLANTKKLSGWCFTIYLAFACHLMYHLKVHTCYTIQYSQCVK